MGCGPAVSTQTGRPHSAGRESVEAQRSAAVNVGTTHLHWSSLSDLGEVHCSYKAPKGVCVCVRVYVSEQSESGVCVVTLLVLQDP